MIKPYYLKVDSSIFSPVDLYMKLGVSRNSVLLESARFNEKTGKFSIIGFSPKLVFKSKRDEVFLEKGGSVEKISGNPIEILKQLLKEKQVLPIEGLPNFLGGGIGYFSYEVGHFFEEYPRDAVDDLGLPEIYFVFFDDAIIFDHMEEKIYIVSLEDNCNDILDKIMAPPEFSPVESSMSFSKVRSNFTKDEFEEIVRTAKEYIRAGDIFQVNLSQRLEVDFDGDGFHLYRKLRNINPSPFGCFLNFDEVKIASSSPERLLRVEGARAETRPIAGTYPRGEDFVEDMRISGELLLDKKERAEHIMLVDLERNDLGRVCKYGTVKVDELTVVERYSHVFHIVSNVSGELRDGCDRFDLIKAAFPGGTITGTPKIRSMQIIDELEPVARGIYTGSIGYLSYSGGMDLNIVIRTFVIKDRKAYIQVGSGIVADSDPTREYFETLHKAEALVKTIEGEGVEGSHLYKQQVCK